MKRSAKRPKRRSGVGLIRRERERQITSEGWTAHHDDRHKDFQLTDAAVCYAKRAMCLGIHAQQSDVPGEWPRSWAKKWWKPSPWGTGEERPLIKREDSIRMLVKAGALIAAEIDRIQRLL